MDQKKNYLLGFDVGGTNSDSVLLDLETQKIVSSSSKDKSHTSSDVVTGMKNSLNSLFENTPNCSEVKDNIKCILVGTTHYLNAFIQKGSNTDEVLNQVSVIRLCGPATQDFRPFCSIENEELKQRIQGISYMIDGGKVMLSSNDYVPLDDKQILKVCESLEKNNVHNIVICGMFSQMSVQHNQQEIYVKEYIEKYFQNKNFEISITVSFQVSERLGILERENASIVNESLKGLAQKSISSYKQVLQDLGLQKIHMFFSKNDGSVMDEVEVQKFPVFTFSASVINSMKGAMNIYQKYDSIIVDLGGTSTDVAVVQHGQPKLSPHNYVENGVPLNFRKPLTNSIALGGGSIIVIEKIKEKVSVKVLKDSVSNQVLIRSISFGGDVLTNTDFALLNKQVQIKGADVSKIDNYFKYNLKLSEQEVQQVIKQQKEKVVEILLDEVLRLITPDQQKKFREDKTQVQLQLVGGGACIVCYDTLKKLSGNIFDLDPLDQQTQIANAIGATQIQISENYQEGITYEDENKFMQYLDDQQKKLEEKILSRGGLRPVNVLEKQFGQANYVSGKIRQAKIILTCKFDWFQYEKLFSCDLKSQTNNSLQNTNYFKPYLKFQEKYYIYARKIDNSIFDNDSLLRDTTDFKVVLEIKSFKDIEDLAWGCGIVGSGGGGSTEKVHLLFKELFKKHNNRTLKMYDPRSLKPGQKIAGVAAYGAPIVFNEFMYQIQESVHCYHYINQKMGGSVVGIACAELGGLNGLIPIITAYELNVPVFDCNVMCRAFPEFGMILPSIMGDSCLPVVQFEGRGSELYVDQQGKVTKGGKPYNYQSPDDPKIKIQDITNFDNFRAVEEILRTSVQCNYDLISSIGCLPHDAEQIEKQWFLYGYKQIIAIGSLMRKGLKENQKSIQEVVEQDFINIGQYQNTKVLIQGKIMSVDIQSKDGYDVGTVLVKSQTVKDLHYSIWLKNEYLLATEQYIDEDHKVYKERVVATTPDILTILETGDGSVIHSEHICYGLNVTVIVLRIDDKYATPRALENVGPQIWGHKCGHIKFYEIDW